MKRIVTFGSVLAVVAAVVLLFSCQFNVDSKDNPDPTRPTEVDWTDYQTAGTYAIRIKNESNRDLVAFKNSLIAANLLGGIPKNANNHGIKRDTGLFNANTDFSIIFITVEDYQANKSNLAVLEQRPFTRIFAMYNATGTNEVPFIVSGKLGGNNKLVVNNLSSWNMELRQDSPRGTTLGYAPYQALNTTLNMNDGSFYVFPVFKKYNAVRDEIITIYPVANDGLPVGDEFSFVGSNELTINSRNYTGQNANFSSGAALLVIRNASQQGITVMEGNTVKKTETGISTINAGEERTFTVLMDKLSDGNKYETSKAISAWKVVNMGTREKAITPVTLDADYRYTITVEGNWNNGVDTITVSDPVQGTGKITGEF